MSGDPNAPWTRGGLSFARAALAEAEAEAVRCYPSEGCGFFCGPAENALHVDACMIEANEADKYHALDPDRFPRTSRMYFKINELRAARAFETGARAGRPIKVIFHSHCDAGAYFSAEDSATFASNDTLMWPCAFLVISVVDGVVKDRKLWVHRPGSNEFDEAQFSVID